MKKHEIVLLHLVLAKEGHGLISVWENRNKGDKAANR